MATVVTNIALVLDGFQTAIQSAHITGSTLPVVYDESLEYQEAIRTFRSRNKILNQKITAERLLVYNREVMRPSEDGVGKRRQTALDAVASPPDNVNLFKVVFGVLPIRFLFATPNAREMESFELGYMVELGIRTVKTITSTFPGLNDNLTHYIHWDELESKEIQVAESYRKVVAGACRIQGFFLVLRDESSPSPWIRQINTLIQNEDLFVYDQDTILPTIST